MFFCYRAAFTRMWNMVCLWQWLEMEGKESAGKNPTLWVIAFQIRNRSKKHWFVFDLVPWLYYMVGSFCSRTWRFLLNTLFQNSPNCLLSRKLPGSSCEGPHLSVVYWFKYFNQCPTCSVEYTIFLVMLHLQPFMVMIFLLIP